MTLYQVAIYFDDGESPMAYVGSVKDFAKLSDAHSWAKREIHDLKIAQRMHPDDGYWYAEISSGKYVDIGDDDWPDLVFESDFGSGSGPGISKIVR